MKLYYVNRVQWLRIFGAKLWNLRRVQSSGIGVLGNRRSVKINLYSIRLKENKNTASIAALF